jgi:hypothetical protein
MGKKGQPELTTDGPISRPEITSGLPVIQTDHLQTEERCIMTAVGSLLD